MLARSETGEMPATQSPIDYGRLDSRADRLAASFRDAQPFPHVVVDDFLPVAACDALLSDFQRLEDPSAWGHYVHYNERKLAMRDPARMSAGTRAIIAELSSPRFVAWLERISGIAGLLPDPEMDGGGLHRIPSGGHLNVHVDFLAHPTQRTWSRQINLLLYLNREWEPSWNGQLEFWDSDMTRRVKAIEPIFNRCVIFQTRPGSLSRPSRPARLPAVAVAQVSGALLFPR